MRASGRLLRPASPRRPFPLPSPQALREALEVLVDRASRLDPRALILYRGADARARNEARLYAEAFWTAVLAAVVAFNAAFAVRLGASTELVGLLSSLPALVAVAATLPAGAVVQRSQRRVRIVARSLLVHRLGYLLVALLPLAFATGRAEALVALLVVMTLPAVFVNVSFSTTLADVVPEDRRAAVVAGRNIANSAVIMLLTPLIGRWLDLIAFPANYQAAYFVGFLASLLGVRALGLLDGVSPPPRPPARSAGWARELRAAPGAALRLIRGNPPFVRLAVDTLVHGAGLWLVTPLYVLHYVRDLDATDTWIGTFTAVASLCAVVGFYVWRKVISRLGEDRPLRVTIVLTALFPIAVALSSDLTLIIVFAALNGLVTPGLSLSHFNTLLKVCTAEQRATFFSLYSTLMNCGAFVSPLVGVAVANWLGIPAALALGGGIWLVGGALFNLWPVRPRAGA